MEFFNEGVVGAIGVAVGGVATAVFTYIRGRKKDVGDFAMQAYLQISKEHSDLRESLRVEVKELRQELRAVQDRATALAEEVARLRAERTELREENDRLEARLKQLEEELEIRQAGAPLVVPQ